jgi:hypothetical protein
LQRTVTHALACEERQGFATLWREGSVSAGTERC